MAKTKSKFVCQNCGANYLKWQGQCSSCQQWNTLVEEIIEPKDTAAKGSVEIPEDKLRQMVQPLSEVKQVSGSKQRFLSGISELDRVLGGGIVPGAVILMGGEPGIGKSTLLTQMCLQLNTAVLSKESKQAKKRINNKKNKKQLTVEQSAAKQSNENNKTKNETNKNKNNVKNIQKSKIVQNNDNEQKIGSNKQKILYICGEESPEQINLRIGRIFKNEQFLSKSGFGKSSDKAYQLVEQNLQFVTSTDVDQIASIINKIKPKLVVVDSIQTLATQDLTGASGSVGQIRESTARLIKIAKKLSVSVFLVGHVTKKGNIAGPKVLEHMVDAVLQLEGERTGQFRMLRALKNRFGATDEVGVFKVVDYGYEEVTNPSEIFVENEAGEVPGSAVTCVMEGTRPMLLEVQALVNQSQLPMPRRVGRGIKLSRIQILAAVMQKHAKQPLTNYDIFLSAAGGFNIKEPAVDLALSVAIASSLNNTAVKSQVVFIGEVGLLGEVRPVPYLDRRIKEAKRLGYKQMVTAKSHKWLKEVLDDFAMQG